jgi:cold shock CspA family protein
VQQRFKTLDHIDTDTRRHRGVVVHYNEIKCYGFIRSSDFEADIFFRAHGVKESGLTENDLARGDEVEFSLSPHGNRSDRVPLLPPYGSSAINQTTRADPLVARERRTIIIIQHEQFPPQIAAS